MGPKSFCSPKGVNLVTYLHFYVLAQRNMDLDRDYLIEIYSCTYGPPPGSIFNAQLQHREMRASPERVGLVNI